MQQVEYARLRCSSPPSGLLNIAMNYLFKTLCLLLGFCCFFSTRATAEVAKRVPLKTVPAFIEGNKRNRDVIFNNAKYDRNAKVYYIFPVYSVSYSYGINDRTKFLAKASRKIYRKGADLIITVDFSDTDAKYTAGGYDIPGQAKSASVKSPIVNSFKSVTKRALFDTKKYTRTPSSSHIYVSSDYLRAIDADGYLLAYFYQNDDTIVMVDPESRDRKTILEGNFDSGTWEADAILATYKELVARVEQMEAQEAPDEPAQSDEIKEEVVKPKKKESSKKKVRWKKVDIDG